MTEVREELVIAIASMRANGRAPDSADTRKEAEAIAGQVQAILHSKGAYLTHDAVRAMTKGANPFSTGPSQTDRVYQGDSGVTVKWTRYDEDRFNASRRSFHFQEEHPVRSILSDREEVASLAWDAVLLLGVAVFAWYVYHALSVVYRDTSIKSAVVHLFVVVGAALVLTALLRYRCPVLSVAIFPATLIAFVIFGFLRW